MSEKCHNNNNSVPTEVKNRQNQSKKSSFSDSRSPIKVSGKTRSIGKVLARSGEGAKTDSPRAVGRVVQTEREREGQTLADPKRYKSLKLR